MSEVVDFWNAIKEKKRESRSDSLAAAQSEWTEYVAAADAGGYALRIMSERHWNVYKNVRAVAQYWPSANKWQIVKTGKIHNGSREDFRKAMREGRL